MKAFLSFPIILLFTLSSCDLLDSTKVTRRHFTYTRADSIEAYEAALWFTGKLKAPDSIMSIHLYNLKYIRSEFADSVPTISVTFMPPWIPGEILVKFDDSTAGKVRNGTYTGWDSLDLELRPTDSSTPPDNLGWALLKFRKSFHPRRLAEIYRPLSGVVYAEPNGISSPGGSFSTIYPAIVDGIYTYYFSFADIKPESSEYFKMINNSPRYIGRWCFACGDTMPPWYNEVQDIVYNFGSWDGYR